MGGHGDSESGSGGDGGGEGGTLKTEKDGERQQISEAVRQSCNGPTRVSHGHSGQGDRWLRVAAGNDGPLATRGQSRAAWGGHGRPRAIEGGGR